MQTTAQLPAGAAPGSAGYRNAWLAHGGVGGFFRQPGEGPGGSDSDTEFDGHFLMAGVGSLTRDALARLPLTEAQLGERIRAASAGRGSTPAAGFFGAVRDAFLETPAPSRLRGQLLHLLLTAPGTASVRGVDALGRPVLWVWVAGLPVGRQDTAAFDEVTGWLVEYGTGAVTPQGRFVGTPFVVTAIDTDAPPPRLPLPASTVSPVP